VTEARRAHWDQVYRTKAASEVSWYEAHPQCSLRLLQATRVRPEEPIIDVGGGASLLAEELLDAGYGDVSVLDVSAEALEKVRARLGARASAVSLISEDVTAFRPERRYALWHDRAVFHFLVDPADRERYIEALRRALRPQGHLIIATFGPSGPERCSGLPARRYDAQALAAELGREFRLVESALQTHRTPWNSTQEFLYGRFERHA
jgi:SAM-dependent methyltransferase